MNESQTTTNEAPAKKGGLLRPIGLLAVVLAVLIGARYLGIGERIEDLRGWIDGLGALGPVVFVALYIVGVVAALPGSALTLAAGALFGALWGVVLVSIGSTVGASLAFLISRYFARDAMEQRLGGNEKFQRLANLTETQGHFMVALTRLVPLFPFNLLNYGFGLTRVPFWTYVFWSWLCMLPGTIVYVVGADALTKGLAEGKAPWPLIGALGAGIVILTLLVRSARKKLKAAETEAGTTPAGQ